MPEPRAYYIDLGAKDVRTGMYDVFDFDDEGVPRYPYRSGLDYNITFICHFALYHLSRYLRYRESEALGRFRSLSRWIVDNGVESEDSFTFPFGHTIPGLDPPWLSALGQGRILSVLTRAAEDSGDPRFLEVARKAMKPFQVPVAEGGVQTRFPDGGIAFEEYPRRRRNIVLNGLITALFGVYDLASSGDAGAGALFEKAIHSLEANLGRYDLGYWSAYDITGPIRRVAGDEYHHYHQMQLWALFEITGIETFRTYADRWRGYRKTPRLHLLRTLSRANTLVKYSRLASHT